MYDYELYMQMEEKEEEEIRRRQREERDREIKQMLQSILVGGGILKGSKDQGDKTSQDGDDRTESEVIEELKRELQLTKDKYELKI